MPPKFVRGVGSEVSSSRPSELVSLLNAGDSDDEDFFLKGPRMSGPVKSDAKIGKLQNKVGEVIDVMKDNVNKVMDRGYRLEELQDRSDDLVNNSELFRSRSGSLRHRMWWQNCRAKIIIGIVILLVLALIIIPIIVQNS